MGKEKRFYAVFCLVFCFALGLSAFVYAQRPLEVDYLEVEGLKPETTSITLPDYVKYIFNFSLALSGLIVFGALIIGGFRYLTSAGNPSAQREARDTIISAFLGLLVLFGSYMLLSIINPQLVMISLPGRTVFTPGPGSGITLAEPTLYYTEVPVGGIIEVLFLRERLNEIKKDSASLEAQALVIRDLSNDLKALTDNCVCDPRVDRGTCEAGSCSPWAPDCINNCYCEGDPYTVFDPCPDRAAIDVIRQDIKDEVNDEDAGLQYRQEEFQKELDGFTDIYNDLLSAKQIIKDCRGVGSWGGMRSISNYADFNVYLDRVKDTEEIKKFVPDFPFDYVTSTNPYFQDTFYCSESAGPYLEVNLEEIAGFTEEISEEASPIQTMYCQDEIPIGETIDNAIELARRMLVEMNNINDNALDEIDNALELSDLPEDCVGSNCNSRMPTNSTCCADTCIKCNEPPPEEEDPWGPEEPCDAVCQCIENCGGDNPGCIEQCLGGE